MSVVLGKNIILMVQRSGVYVPIATGRDVSLEGNREALETTSTVSGKFREYIKGKIGFTITISGLVSFNYSPFFTADNLFDEFIGNDSGNILFQFIATVDGASMIYSGAFVLSQYSMKRSYNDVASFDLSAMVTGPVTRTLSGSYIPAPTTGNIIVNPSEVTSLEYTATGGEVITYPALMGHVPLIITRGGIEVGQLIQSGTPVGSQVLYNSATGTLTFSTDSPLVAGELVRIIYASSIYGYQMVSTTAGTSLTVSLLESYTLVSFSRGGLAQSIITSGTPTGAQILFNSSTGVITFSSDVPLTVGENLNFVYE